MKKKCDNCSKELTKFALFSPDKKIYMYNNAMLCSTCFAKIRAREQLNEI